MSPNPAFKLRYVMVKLGTGHFRVNLRGRDVRVAEYLAHALYWHTVIESHHCERVPRKVKWRK